MQLLRMAPLLAALLLAWTGALHAADDYAAAALAYRNGQQAEALTRLDALLQANPRDARARFLRGVILTEQKRTDEAIRAFTELTQDFPELAEPYNNLGVIYASRGEYLRAREALEMAVRADPGYATAHENLGDVYSLLAGEAYGRAVRLDKGNRSAPAKLALVRQAVPTAAATRAAGAPDAAAPARSAGSTAAPGVGGSDPAPRAVDGASAAPGAAASPLSEGPAGRPAAADTAAADAATLAVLKTVDDWAAAWSRGDAPRYLAFYAPDFKPVGGEPRAKWEAARRDRLTRGQRVSIAVRDARASFSDADHAVVTFRQDYSSESIKRSTRKSLHLQRHGDRWLITRETIAKA